MKNDSGKKKCELLKAIRAYVADKYGLEYEPSVCTHEGGCVGSCAQCDKELADIHRQLEAKGITRLAEDAKLSELVAQFASAVSNGEGDGADAPVPEEIHRIGMMSAEKDELVPLQGDIMPVIEAGLMPDPGEEDRRLFMECYVAGISFHQIDDLWNELREGTKLALVRQRNNKYDKNAVAVALAGDYDGDPDHFDFRLILGYIPRTDNEGLAAMLDMGWESAFETEISELNEQASYRERIRIAIYVKGKDTLDEEESKGFHLQLFRDKDWQRFTTELWQKGFCHFRWGGFPPWHLDLPEKGDKVVFAHKKSWNELSLYLMQVVAIGDEAEPYLDSEEELDMVDDCEWFVLTNVAGPVVVEPDELELPAECFKDHWQPDQRVGMLLSERLMSLFKNGTRMTGAPNPICPC